MTGKKILNASHHERASVTGHVRTEFVHRQPMCAYDIGVKRSQTIMMDNMGLQCKTKIGDIGSRVFPPINAHQMIDGDRVACFFQSFSNCRFRDGFPGFKVSSGLVKLQTGNSAFLNHQEAIFPLDQRCHRYVRGPDHQGNGARAAVLRIIRKCDAKTKRRGRSPPPPRTPCLRGRLCPRELEKLPRNQSIANRSPQH